jgi:hypothetical protein
VGKVIVSARIENVFDLYEASRGQLALDQVRHVDVSDARVDTGGTLLAGGMATFGMYSPVRLTVQGRDCAVEVAELPDECTALIGVIPLEILDFVVNPKSQKLIGNPAHGDQIFDMF